MIIIIPTNYLDYKLEQVSMKKLILMDEYECYNAVIINYVLFLWEYIVDIKRYIQSWNKLWETKV